MSAGDTALDREESCEGIWLLVDEIRTDVGMLVAKVTLLTGEGEEQLQGCKGE